ncbi:MAG: hypothetical protein LC126_06520 [Bryobacterales bacterium]|nr:hypothetical protein [Bryobacterales bacterium]
MRLAVVFALASSLYAETTLKVTPSEATLPTVESREQFLAEGTTNGFQEDLTKTAQWTSSNPKVAVVDAGKVKPAGDGEAVITATVNGQKATATVRVKDFTQPFTWSFRNHVIPVLTKIGCNSAPATERWPGRTDSS